MCGSKGYMELFLLSAQFCHEPKTVLRNTIKVKSMEEERELLLWHKKNSFHLHGSLKSTRWF
jgi:hypothetical protein